MSKTYVHNLDACLLVCDLTNERSFEAVSKWAKDVRNIKNIPIVLLANKYDLTEERAVQQSQLDSLAKKLKIRCFETSAKSGYNVENSFYCLVYQILKPCLEINDIVKSEITSSGLKGGPMKKLIDQEEDPYQLYK